MSNSFISSFSGDVERAYGSAALSALTTYTLNSDLYAVGYNTQGQLMDNTIVNKSVAIQCLPTPLKWSSISAGVSGNVSSTAGIKEDGSLWLWGRNNAGQLGDGSTLDRSSPVQTVSGGTNWKQVAASSSVALNGVVTAAIKTDGTLWLWGANAYGQLGDGTVIAKSSPVQTVAAGTTWKQVATGAQGFVSAIKTDGTLWSWGSNSDGQLGDNTSGSTLKRSSPVQTIAGGTTWSQVSCGRVFTAAIKTDGTLWLWGNNASGQLGNNAAGGKSSPVQTISGGTNWKQVSCGYNHVAAIKTDGTLWLWGNNANGQLGDGTVAVKSSPVQTISSGSNWAYVACGDFQTLGIKTDGTVWSWGNNAAGQLGDATVSSKSSPVQLAMGGSWTSVASGYRRSYFLR